MQPSETAASLEAELAIGWASEIGPRSRNDDFGGSYLGSREQRTMHGSVIAIADGMGGARGGRVAAETVISGFIDGFYSQSETLDIERATARVLEPLNRWIAAQGRTEAFKGMGTTFSALILHGRAAHVVHVGDSRIYRWRQGRLERLTTDHTLEKQGMSHVLYRAVGIEDSLRLDFARHELRPRDRFVLTTDGVHGALSDEAIAGVLAMPVSPDEMAQRLVRASLAAGGQDNASAFVADILHVPPPGPASLEKACEALPIREPPKAGQSLDGYRIERELANGRYSRLFAARDEREDRRVALKFPQPGRVADAVYRLAYAREAWVASQVQSPWIAEVMPIAPERQSQLYNRMPLYEGETLESRLRRHPPLSLGQLADVAGKLAKGIAALHRSGIVHRDVKPENIMLAADGGLKLLDLGVAQVAKQKGIPIEAVPGTASYMAPEMFQGMAGNERTDQFALAVTLYRSFCGGAYPYGEIEPFSHPRFGKPAPMSRHRADTPAWLDFTIARALAINPEERFGDVIEFASALENGLIQGVARIPKKPLPIYERNPLLFWQLLTAALFILLLVTLAGR